MLSQSKIRLLLLGAFSAAVGLGEAPSANATLDRYLNRSVCQANLDEHAMEVDIQASLPKLKKQGSMQGLKVISASGQIAYRFLRFTGDKLIKTDVIARFLNAEVHPPEHLGDIGITNQNYKFHFLRSDDNQGQQIHVFQLKPRKKREGLFKGELWLDALTASPVREAGELVKSPSIFVSKVRFVRDYTEAASCGPPHRTILTVQTRLAGDAEMVVLQHPVAGTWQPPVEVNNAVNDDNGK